YPKDQTIPKKEVRSIFVFLFNWTRDQAGSLTGSSASTQKVLAAQTQKVIELIDTLPENDLTYLGVERLIRTIYEPAPTQFYAPEVGKLPTIHSAAAVFESIDDLLWWDFVEQTPNYFFSRWTKIELGFLKDHEIELLGPDQQNNRLIWQQLRPVLHTQKRLVLCLPDRVNGDEALPHPLYGDLVATFGDSLDQITVDIDSALKRSPMWEGCDCPPYDLEPIRSLPQTSAHLQIVSAKLIDKRKEETPTSLNKLIYYPHQWFFQYQLGIRASIVLDITADNRLRGNLAHRFIEHLLIDRGNENWSYERTSQWLSTHAYGLLRREGAILLDYGREPERVQFLHTLRFAAWALVDHIQRNDWEVLATEMDVSGEIDEVVVKGRSDVVLRRGDNEFAVIDLKWRGKSVFRSMIKNREDLQLCLYAHFIGGISDTVHTAYFIIKDGKLLTRNAEAFSDVEMLDPDADLALIREEIIAKVEKTYHWRKQQFKKGFVEMRTAQTSGQLDDTYGEELLDLLEMKTEDARFDDYRSLLGMLQ
ncbi:MAG: PD-(D/E)XK nuclease family protein, partial [Bacteroidota bacterium]